MLTFNIKNQTISRTDKFRPVSGSRNYLTAKFSFSEDWTDTEKTALFCLMPDGEVFRSSIDATGMCEVPEAALDGSWPRTLTVSVVGIGDGKRITTNFCTIYFTESGNDVWALGYMSKMWEASVSCYFWSHHPEPIFQVQRQQLQANLWGGHICRKRYQKILRKIKKDRNDAQMWIIRNQLGRRNLSAYDRSVLVLRLEPLISERAKEWK